MPGLDLGIHRDKSGGRKPAVFVCKVIVTLRIRCDPRATLVIPGRAKREPGIHQAASFVVKWIPGSTLRADPE